jgi:inner membrane protein involved in colicin E2 resistance
MKPHIVFNYPLLIGTIAAAFFSAKYLSKIKTKKRTKILYIFTLALLTSLFAILYHWNFFAIVG